MTSLEAYRQIFRDTFATTMSDEEILTYAVVLHTHAIAFRPELPFAAYLERDARGRVVLEALTRRGIAELLAALWPASAERGDSLYWNYGYGTHGGFELYSLIPESERARYDAAKRRLEGHAWIDELIADD